MLFNLLLDIGYAYDSLLIAVYVKITYRVFLTIF